MEAIQMHNTDWRTLRTYFLGDLSDTYKVEKGCGGERAIPRGMIALPLLIGYSNAAVRSIRLLARHGDQGERAVKPPGKALRSRFQQRILRWFDRWKTYRSFPR